MPEKESSDYGYGASNNQGHFDMIQDKCRTMKDSSSFRPDIERILWYQAVKAQKEAFNGTGFRIDMQLIIPRVVQYGHDSH